MTPKLKLDARLAKIGGCSNGGCLVVPPTGMCTNGPCHCLENRVRALQVVMAYKNYVIDTETEPKPKKPLYDCGCAYTWQCYSKARKGFIMDLTLGCHRPMTDEEKMQSKKMGRR